ncbi:hypothetical protein, partial [Levilactobacillus brevis]|uniref:hypothetical protein n=2 Tax=Levilactobacillus brevis TaxID=1580 RepID=UPI001BAA0F87
FVVNTILKEADLFCPNSVRINFTIYHTDYVSAWRLFKNGDLRVAATYSDQILKKSSETSPKISSLTPVVSGEVLFLYTTILTRMNSKKVKDMNLDLVLWKDQLELKDTDLRLRLDELILQTTRGIQPSESLERFLELQKSYLKEINETSIWEANVWSVKYAIFLSHINAYDWSGTGENKAKYFENAIKLVEQRSSKNAGLYLDILNNAAGDFYWRDSAYVKKALQIITQVTKLSNKELPDNLAGIYAYNKIIMSVYSVNKQKSINCILN